MSASGPGGDGTTEVCVTVGKEDFSNLCKVMAEVDCQAALTAMSAEVARRLATSHVEQHDEGG